MEKTEKTDDSVLFGDKKLRRMPLNGLLENPVSSEIEKIPEAMKRNPMGLKHYAEVVSIALARRKKVNKLIRCLDSVDLLPYRDINTFKDEMEYKANRSRLIWSFIIFATIIADMLFISSASIIHILFEVALFVALLVVAIANFRRPYWQSISLDDYDQLVPDSLLQKITIIKDTISDVQFYVAKLTRAPANLKDCLLEVYLPIETYDPKAENQKRTECPSWTVAHWQE